MPPPRRLILVLPNGLRSKLNLREMDFCPKQILLPAGSHRSQLLDERPTALLTEWAKTARRGYPDEV